MENVLRLPARNAPRELRSEESRDYREGRRIRAWELRQAGWKQSAIAEALGVTAGAVSQWLKRAREMGGAGALVHRKPPGAKPRLSAEQMAELKVMLARGAEAFGFTGDVWTRDRVRSVITEHFGVTFGSRHVSRLLHQIDFSWQKPVRKATQRDEEAIQEWREIEWPRLKKKAQDEGRTVVFVDESAFYLLPAVVHTWAPTGQTPVLNAPLSREHLSAIAGVSDEGSLSVQAKEHSIRGKDAVSFVKHLRQVFGPRLLVAWDGAAIHHNAEVKAFLRSPAGTDVQFVSWPGYAPELDPVESVWQHTKHVALGNVCNRNVADLKRAFGQAMAHLRRSPELIRGFFRHAGV